MEMTVLIDRLAEGETLSREEYRELIEKRTPEISEYLFSKARSVREKYYGRDIYVRGLIEFTNICKNDCLYCGIRRSNKNAPRYRLTKEQILSCCEEGYGLGFRTFVLQGGEDGYYTDDVMTDIIGEIKGRFPECALTLSVGEKSRESYEKYFRAGADRFLLRHETASDTHYRRLHPENMSPVNRKRCLYDLKDIGFQTGSGFMVGSPYQTADNLAEDMVFLKELSPHMVGIGPFIPHKDTPFGDMQGGTLELTLFMTGLARLTLPRALIPATTALGTISPKGREKGMLAGANVIMPNLSPPDCREKYMLYNNKLSSGSEAAEHLEELKKQMSAIGYSITMSRGDFKPE